MRKKNTLYTANKWNRPLFMPKDENLFAVGSMMNVLNSTTPGVSSNKVGNVDVPRYSNIVLPASTAQPGTTTLQSLRQQPTFVLSPIVTQSSATQNKPATVPTAQSIVATKPENKPAVTATGVGSTVGAAASHAAEAARNGEEGTKGKAAAQTAVKVAGAAAAQAGSVPMTIDGREYKRGLFDATDPFYHAGDVTFDSGEKGHIENGVGNAFSDVGVGVFQAGASMTNPYVMLAGAALKSIGDIANNGWGVAVNDAELARGKQRQAYYGNYDYANSLDDISPLASFISPTKPYKGGVFRDVDDDNEEYMQEQNELKSFAERSRENNIRNIMLSRIGRQLADDNAHPFAYGGFLGDDSFNNNMGAIEYGFMSDYLENKKKQTENKNRVTNMFMGSQPLFAFGGDMQTNSADFSTGLVHVNAGGSHELNPNDGVQMGVDNEGVPNLVEEKETVYNDYVYSNRINLDQQAKERFHFPKKKDITYAEATKKLEKEIAETPNDPISQAGFKAQMESLAEEQERQKAEMEAARAREAFEALSPEEQTAIMQRAAQEEAAQNAAQQQNQMLENVNSGNYSGFSPEQAVMMQADGSQAMLGQEPQMACGGKINKYAEGGYKKNAGSWKKGTSSENWQAYTKNGLRDYLLMINDRLAEAKSDEDKKKIREEAIKTVNDIQKAYSEAYQSNLSPSEKSEKVEALQKAFEKAGGNAYFGGIANNINLPKGHNTADTEEKGWVDGYWGPRTSIRNWGSTEYGDADYYNDIAELANEAGLSYAPGEYKYGDHTLYQLGMAPEEVTQEAEPELVVDYGDSNTAVTPEEEVVPTTTTQTPPTDKTDKGIAPDHRPEWLRYAGLFGPAVGLGLQMAGVGKPDYSGLDAAVSKAGNVALADYQPIGDYLRYNPMDIWFEQNRMDANARATERALANNASPSKAAAILASGYNSQIASGDLYRKALEYNDAQRERVAAFNRGTNQFNAESYNRNSQFNAAARNQANQASTQAKLNAAAQKLDSDAGWYNSLYGNIGGIFKGLSDIGRENAQHNMISKMAANGLYGTANPDTPVFQDFLKWREDQKKKGKHTSAKGGKINKKHDIIL